MTLADIQHAAKYGQVLLSSHAEERMGERNISFNDIRNAIKTANAVIDQGGKGLVTGGVDRDGQDLQLVVRLIRPGLLIVTVY